MNIVLISTCNMRGRTDLVERMLASVDRANAALGGERIRLYLLVQECSAEEFANFRNNTSQFVHLDQSPKRLSLSAARNRLMKHVLNHPLQWERTVIGFPDDDAWYPAGTLEAVVSTFKANKHLQFWFCRYASSPVRWEQQTIPKCRRPSLTEAIRRASSNTIFLRGDLAKTINVFDETLGVGTPNGSGEDTDVAIRAFALASDVAYCDAPLIGHRDFVPALRGKYYRGGLITLARYVGVVDGIYFEFLRKLAVGAYLTLRREITAKNYLSAAHSAFTEIGRGTL